LSRKAKTKLVMSENGARIRFLPKHPSTPSGVASRRTKLAARSKMTMRDGLVTLCDEAEEAPKPTVSRNS
jgi:hypothetical protein